MKKKTLNPTPNFHNINEAFKIKLIEIPDHAFFNNDFIQTNIFKKPLTIDNKIFIFRNYDWELLKKEFKKFNYSLSGGSLTYRHLLTPPHMRLAHFLICLEGYKPENEGTTFSYLWNKKRHKLLNIQKFEDNEYSKKLIKFISIVTENEYNNDQILNQLYKIYYNSPKLFNNIMIKLKELLNHYDSSNPNPEIEKEIMNYPYLIMEGQSYTNKKNELKPLKDWQKDALGYLVIKHLIWKGKKIPGDPEN